MVSSCARSFRLRPKSSVKVNVSATGMGSDTPVDSIRIESKRPSLASVATSCIKSSRSVQQMQPLLISTIFSSVRESLASPLLTSWASTLTSLMSFTITATLRPSRLRRMWLSSVVFPAPRKPESTVTGSLEVFVFMGKGSLAQTRRRDFGQGSSKVPPERQWVISSSVQKHSRSSGTNTARSLSGPMMVSSQRRSPKTG
jgi:hypothetical protein